MMSGAVGSSTSGRATASSTLWPSMNCSEPVRGEDAAHAHADEIEILAVVLHPGGDLRKRVLIAAGVIVLGILFAELGSRS
jgi:hypothetical protein